MDAPDWVSWRWGSGVAGAILLLGLWWWRATPGPEWAALPILLALAVPRLRTEPGPPISLPTLALQNLPALALAVWLVRAVTSGAGTHEAVLASAAFLGVVGIAHGAWFTSRHHQGLLAGIGVLLGAWCAALGVSGWLLPLEEGLLLILLTLGLGLDLSTTLSPTWREDTWVLPSVVAALLVLVLAGLPILDGGAPPAAVAVTALVLTSLPVVWAIKRRARRQSRSHLFASP